MRIDVITFQGAYNYGAVLQAFATQEFMRQHGVDARIIHFMAEGWKSWKRFMILCSRGSVLTMPVRLLPALAAVCRGYTVFEKFRQKHLIMSNDKIYSTPEDFADYESDADAFCTGSDQVWAPHFNRSSYLPAYLPFVPEEKYKFSFATSFGVDEVPPEYVSATQKYIDRYNRISVREDSGLKILNEQYHYKNAVHVLDPTLCLSGNTWQKYIKLPLHSGNYILVYSLTNSAEQSKYAETLAEKTGLKIIRLCATWSAFSKNFFRRGKKIILPKIFDFISLINNARYVLTDSFHGTAFALNLNTEPICIFPEKFGGRLESILKLTGTLDRRVKSYDDFSILDRHVDFSHVNTVLDSERRKVSEWFSMVLDEIRASK